MRLKVAILQWLRGAQVNLGALRIYGRYVAGINNVNAVTNTDKWRHQTNSIWSRCKNSLKRKTNSSKASHKTRDAFFATII